MYQQYLKVETSINFYEDQLLLEEIQYDALEIYNETESIDNHSFKQDTEEV